MSDETLAAIVAELENAPAAGPLCGAARDAVAPAPGQRSWGFAVQLYSLRSRGSWGHGDLRDLADLATWSAQALGAGFVQVNPLHAAEPLPPVSASPYLPMSRRWVSPLYLRIEDIPEYRELSGSERERLTQLSAPLRDASRDVAADRPGRGLGGQARGARGAAQGAADGRAAGRPGPVQVPARPGPGGLGRLVRAGRGARPRLPDLARRAARPAAGGGRGPAGRPGRAGRVPRLGPVAGGGAGRGGPGGRPGGRHADRRHRRPGHRRPSGRRRRVGRAGVLRRRVHRGGAAGRVQPARPGLDPAPAAPAGAGRGRLPAAGRPDRGEPGAWAAACASTT